MDERINRKYIDICRKYGLRLRIEDEGAPQSAPPDDDAEYFVRIDFAQVPEGQYETYLTYYIRKLLLPMLTLKTDRLLLRRLRKEDAEDLFESFADADSARLDSGTEPFDEMDDEYSELFGKICASETKYAIVLRQTGRAIGLVSLKEKDDRQVEAMEIGYCINPSQQRRGYASEAVSAMLKLLQEELKLDLVLANCVELNDASLKLLDKLGFVYEGRKHKAFWDPVPDAPVDLLCFYRETEVNA